MADPNQNGCLDTIARLLYGVVMLLSVVLLLAR